MWTAAHILASGTIRRTMSAYLRFEPMCRKSGLLIKVENGIWVCSPSRRTLIGISKPSRYPHINSRRTYTFTLRGNSSASELAKEKGSISHSLQNLLEGTDNYTKVEDNQVAHSRSIGLIDGPVLEPSLKNWSVPALSLHSTIRVSRYGGDTFMKTFSASIALFLKFIIAITQVKFSTHLYHLSILGSRY